MEKKQVICLIGKHDSISNHPEPTHNGTSLGWRLHRRRFHHHGKAHRAAVLLSSQAGNRWKSRPWILWNPMIFYKFPLFPGNSTNLPEIFSSAPRKMMLKMHLQMDNSLHNKYISRETLRGRLHGMRSWKGRASSPTQQLRGWFSWRCGALASLGKLGCIQLGNYITVSQTGRWKYRISSNFHRGVIKGLFSWPFAAFSFETLAPAVLPTISVRRGNWSRATWRIKASTYWKSYNFGIPTKTIGTKDSSIFKPSKSENITDRSPNMSTSANSKAPGPRFVIHWLWSPEVFADPENLRSLKLLCKITT